MRSSTVETKLKQLENYLSRPINLSTFSAQEISKASNKHEVIILLILLSHMLGRFFNEAQIWFVSQTEQKRLNNESVEVNEILKLCELGATECEDLRMYTDSNRLRRMSENLDDRWKHLISGFSSKKASLVNLREKVGELDEKCDLLEMLLTQVEETLNGLDEQQSCTAQVIELVTSLQAMAPKVEDLSNDYSFLTKQVHASDPGAFSGRVKGVVRDWRSHLTRCHQLMEALQRTEAQAQFDDAYSYTNAFYQSLCHQVRLAFFGILN